MIVLIYLLLIVPLLIVVGIAVAVRRQSNVTQSYSKQAQADDARVYAESTKVREKTITEALAAKARDPRLSTMTNEDLVYEVLKECYDPEIPLNVVDLGLICSVQVNRDSVDLKITMTSPQCPSHVSISEDIKTRLTDAGFPTPKIEL